MTMNIFTALRAMDRRDASFIDSLPPEDRRDIDSSLGYTALRWMRAAKDEDLHAYYIQAVNELANVNYFSFSAHKELQFKLLALTGVGSPTKHEWIAPPKGTKEGKMVNLIMTLIPDIEAEDALLWYEMNGKDGLDDLPSRVSPLLSHGRNTVSPMVRGSSTKVMLYRSMKGRELVDRSLEAITSRGTFEAAQVAKAAYALADAMMEARKK